MKSTFIFGHRNPDTDSICSSIALSYLKNCMGSNTVPKAIGHLNNETKFVLKYFNVEEPEFLNDVRVRIKNVEYDKKAFIYQDESIYKAYNIMHDQNITAVPIIDNNKKLIGFVAMKELAKFLISGNKEHINTTLKNIVEVLDADILYKANDLVEGNIMVAGYQSSTFHDEIKLSNNDILIVGDRFKIIDYAISSKVQMIILALNSKIDDSLLEKAIKNNVTIIRSHLSSFRIANTVSLSNYIISINNTDHPLCVFDDDYYTDFKTLTKKIKHTNYPVINHKNECLGLINLNWANEYEKQKIILVDHNNFSQSIEGIEEAEVIEIIDHHNIGSIGTSMPINFRCMTVGATATMIYQMFVEKKVLIPKHIAGLLASAIISDTVLLTSPTTTPDDIFAVNELCKIAEIDLNKYGYEMLKIASSIKGMTINEVIYQDYKTYKVLDKNIGLGQILTMDFEEIRKHINEYVEKLNEINLNNPGIVALFITDVIKEGTYIIYNEESVDIIKEGFNLEEVYEGIFIKGIISRKKQILPAILSVMNK